MSREPQPAGLLLFLSYPFLMFTHAIPSVFHLNKNALTLVSGYHIGKAPSVGSWPVFL